MTSKEQGHEGGRRPKKQLRNSTMEANPLIVYPRLYLYVLKLTAKAVARSWQWLFVAPAAYLFLNAVSGVVFRLVPGIAGGFLVSIIRAAIVSLVLYVARSIIEQRKLDGDDLSIGLRAYWGDVITIFFALWVVGFILGAFVPVLVSILWLLVLLMPTFETVALTQVSGLAMFQSAWQFFRREAVPWLAGHWPLLLLVPASLGWQFALGFVPFLSLPKSLQQPAWDILNAIPWVLTFLAFLYRGILFLTLDGMSKRTRADRFGEQSKT